MPRIKKTVTLDIPQSAMVIFEHLVAEEGYELVENPIAVGIVGDILDEDFDDEDDEDDDDEDDEDDGS